MSERICRGFTLIEVLAVVTIITTLAGLLLPGIAKARERARATSCQSNVRQTGVGMTMYLHQYNVYPGHQWILKSGGIETGRIRWFQAMAGMLRGFAVQGCPSATGWEVGRNNSYGYNYKYLGSARDSAVGPKAPFESFPVRHLRSPARTIAFGDSDGTGWKLPYDANSKDPDRFGNHGYTLDPTFIPVNSLQAYSDGVREPYAWKEYRTYISTRHGGASSVCLADGHVEMMRPRRVYIDNRWWNGLGGEDPVRDPHVPYRHKAGIFRFAADLP